eukprot:4242259-Lingulodinium_polyedra.AAC.1
MWRAGPCGTGSSAGSRRPAPRVCRPRPARRPSPWPAWRRSQRKLCCGRGCGFRARCRVPGCARAALLPEVVLVGWT